MNISGKTRICALIGDPVEHTLSPLIHNNLAELCGIDLTYVPMRVAADRVGSAVRGAYDLGILGLNVTVPHKIAVMDVLAGIDERAAAIGAVNTLVRSDNGYIGYNTDYIGLKRALADDDISLAGRDAVILGAGGAARAAAFLCAFEHAGSVHILNRSVDKAEALCRDVNEYVRNNDPVGNAGLCKPLALADHASVPGRDLIVIQASSVGLFPNINDVIIDDESFYTRISYGYDLVYNPADTRFMRLVKDAGGRAEGGLKMLLYQGICGFELWNRITVSQDAIDQVLDKLSSAARPEKK
ncbi:MAG: shikimate dehydrogenase [Lachnospiraceae bacterium]|nr:shikimate dehydrogenase [Lachnospiraceae bacterium]